MLIPRKKFAGPSRRAAAQSRAYTQQTLITRNHLSRKLKFILSKNAGEEFPIGLFCDFARLTTAFHRGYEPQTSNRVYWIEEFEVALLFFLI